MSRSGLRGVRGRVRRGAAVIAGVSALGAGAVAPIAAAPPIASARFFEGGASEGLVLQPPSPQFACAMRRALADRQIACR